MKIRMTSPDVTVETLNGDTNVEIKASDESVKRKADILESSSVSNKRPKGDEELSGDESVDGEKPKYSCPHCSQKYTRTHNLKSHMLTHSQEKPFTCNVCSSKFRRQHDLKRHAKLHTGEKPFLCESCGRKFSRGDALVRHIKTSGSCAGEEVKRDLSDHVLPSDGYDIGSGNSVLIAPKEPVHAEPASTADFKTQGLGGPAFSPVSRPAPHSSVSSQSDHRDPTNGLNGISNGVGASRSSPANGHSPSSQAFVKPKSGMVDTLELPPPFGYAAHNSGGRFPSTLDRRGSSEADPGALIRMLEARIRVLEDRLYIAENRLSLVENKTR